MNNRKKKISLVLILFYAMVLLWAMALQVSAESATKAIVIGNGQVKKGSTIYMDSNGDAWKVILDETNTGSSGGKLLMAAGSLGSVKFNLDSNSNSNAWQGSNVQAWCRNYYANEFTAGEKAAVTAVSKTDSAYFSYGSFYGYGTSSLNNESFFLLSAEEAGTYFAGDAERQPGGWWLRSPFSFESILAGCVAGGGALGRDSVEIAQGVRPAFNINLSSVLFTSAAEGGKSSGAAGARALTRIGNYSGTEWKLTLTDSGHAGFSAQAGNGAAVAQDAGYSNWRIPVSWSGAGNGEGEYVSALLCNKYGNAIYYGNITEGSSSGTQNVIIPEGLGAGTYTLKVFAEQKNGNKKTDYASRFYVITLTVNSGEGTHTVSFENFGIGSQPASQEVMHGGTALEPEEPSVPGGVFEGWYADSACTAPFDFDAAIIQDTVIYAKWQEVNTIEINTTGVPDYGSYTITGSDGKIYAYGNTSGTLNVPLGVNLTLEISPGEGNKFSGSYCRQGSGQQYETGTEFSFSGTAKKEYDLPAGNYTINLNMILVPKLKLNITADDGISSDQYSVTVMDGTGHSYENGDHVPVPVSGSGGFVSFDDIINVTIGVNNPQNMSYEGTIYRGDSKLYDIENSTTTYGNIQPAMDDLIVNVRFYNPNMRTIDVSAFPETGGEVSGGGRYAPGSSVTVTATPATGFRFVNWTWNGQEVSQDQNYSFRVAEDRNLTANFEQIPPTRYTVSVTASPSYGGMASGGGTFNENANVTVTAVANEDYDFTGWYNGGAKISDVAEYTFTLTADTALTAKFEPKTKYELSVEASPSEGGNVSGGGNYNENTEVTVTATHNEGYSFTGWYKGETKVCDTADYTFSLSSNTSLTAKFEAETVPPTPAATYTVSVSASPAEGGTVSGGGTFNENADIKVTAAAGNGYVFKGWYSGDTKVSDSAEYSFKLAKDMSLTAKFETKAAPPAPVTSFTAVVSSSPAEGGTVSGGGSYRENTSVTVTAKANKGYDFAGWYSGNTKVSDVPNYAFKLTNNISLTAKWEKQKEQTRPKDEVSPDNPADSKVTEQTILKAKNDKDLKGSSFSLLKAKGVAKSKTSVKLSWKTVPGAKQYVIYGNKCGKSNRYKKIKTVTGLSFVHKKLKKGTYYKYMVVAVDGEKALATSKTIHVATAGGKKGNNTGVKLSKKNVSINAGKTKKVTAKLKAGGKKVKLHRKIAWESDNISIATVRNGKITAVKQGQCYIYAYAQNGICARVKVTVT